MDTEYDDTKIQGSIDLFKKWHRTGFVSVAYWATAEKVIVEIGAIDPDKNNALLKATKCFIPSLQFMSYLHAEIHGMTDRMFPSFDTKGVSFFGGTPKPPVVSRIFNSSYYLDYRNNKQIDPLYRTFTCAHYDGEVTGKGVITPIFKNEISKNTMKIALVDLAEMYHLLYMQAIAELTVHTMQELKK